LLRAGAHAVKAEGLRGHADVIAHLVESGIPVMGHLGLTPQSAHAFGGYKVQGSQRRRRGPPPRGRRRLGGRRGLRGRVGMRARQTRPTLTAELPIPTIGIGAGAGCAGQILVLHDLLGFMPEFQPRFVRRFADGANVVQTGVARYAAAVRAGKFPGPKESF